MNKVRAESVSLSVDYLEVERAGEVRQVLKRSDVGKTQDRRFRGRRRGRGRRRVE